jgi:hypothetical protein
MCLCIHADAYFIWLEKKKEKKREISFSALGRKPRFPAPFSSLLAQPRSGLSFGRGPRCGPAQVANVAGRRAFLLFSLADTPGPRVRAFFFLRNQAGLAARWPMPPRFPSPALLRTSAGLINSSPAFTASLHRVIAASLRPRFKSRLPPLEPPIELGSGDGIADSGIFGSFRRVRVT